MSAHLLMLIKFLQLLAFSLKFALRNFDRKFKAWPNKDTRFHALQKQEMFVP